MAAGCGIALGAMLAACGSTSSSGTAPKSGFHGTAPIPSTSTTPATGSTSTTPATGSTSTTPDALSGTPTPATPPSTLAAGPGPTTPPTVVSEFLTADQLPEVTTYGWARQYITAVHVEEPLEPVCGKELGIEANTSAWDARYQSKNGADSAVEIVHTYATAAYAASRVAASFPACPGLTAHPSNGFAWLSPASGADYGGLTHVLYARVDNKVAVLTVTVPKRDYDPSLDAKLLAEMTQRLKS